MLRSLQDIRLAALMLDGIDLKGQLRAAWAQDDHGSRA